MSDLEEQIASFLNGAERFREEHGSVEALVAPDNAFAQLGITSIKGIRIEVESGVKFISHTGQPDIELKGSLIYFHKADHAMFGSEAVNEDGDDWCWWEDDE